MIIVFFFTNSTLPKTFDGGCEGIKAVLRSCRGYQMVRGWRWCTKLSLSLYTVSTIDYRLSSVCHLNRHAFIRFILFYFLFMVQLVPCASLHPINTINKTYLMCVCACVCNY